MFKLGNGFRALVGLALLFSQAGFADWTKLSSDDFTMAEPPEEGSAAYDKDFEELHRFQEERTQAVCKEGYAQVNHSFGNLFGELLSEEELEQLEPLMKKVFKLTSNIGSVFKDTWDRPRPYITDETIKPCVPRPGANRSYPSTHAALGTVGGCVLAKAIPAKAKNLNQHGKRIGELRMLVGVHHPTDVKAGQKLGQDICKALLKDEEFVAEIKP